MVYILNEEGFDFVRFVFSFMVKKCENLDFDRIFYRNYYSFTVDCKSYNFRRVHKEK